MNEDELLKLNEEGFIPGPREDEGAFVARVARTKIFFEKGEWIPNAHWDGVQDFLGKMFDVKPLYIGARYENKGLMPWQGGVAWLDRVCWVQLRKEPYWGYGREEILAHEAVHWVRSEFEGKYEEFFAFMVSEKRWRKFLGPIVNHPWEVWPFLVLMGLGAVWCVWYWGAALWMVIGFWRLAGGHRRLLSAEKAILDVVGEKRVARAILFRLTAQEIEAFAHGTGVKEYARQQSCLRWKLLKIAYLKGIL